MGQPSVIFSRSQQPNQDHLPRFTINTNNQQWPRLKKKGGFDFQIQALYLAERHSTLVLNVQRPWESQPGLCDGN